MLSKPFPNGVHSLAAPHARVLKPAPQARTRITQIRTPKADDALLQEEDWLNLRLLARIETGSDPTSLFIRSFQLKAGTIKINSFHACRRALSTNKQ